MKEKNTTQDTKQVRAFGRNIAKELDIEKLSNVKGGLAVAAGTISCCGGCACDCDQCLL